MCLLYRLVCCLKGFKTQVHAQECLVFQANRGFEPPQIASAAFRAERAAVDNGTTAPCDAAHERDGNGTAHASRQGTSLHGLSGYQDFGCRCELCTLANRE